MTYWFNFIWITSCFGLAILSTIFWSGIDALFVRITNDKNNHTSLIAVISLIISYIALIFAIFAPYNNFYNWDN